MINSSSLLQISVKPDVPSLVMLLQAVGFQLREFEKEELSDGENATKKSSIKLTIKCGTSKMKAVLEMDEIECQCPSESKGGSVWSICGTGPASNVCKFLQSDLLPPEKRNEIKYLTKYCSKY